MGNIDKIHKVTYDPATGNDIFHTYYGKFVLSIDFIKFVNDYSSEAFHSVFNRWNEEHQKSLSKLDSKSKKEYEKILKMYNTKPTKIVNYSVKSDKVQKILANFDSHGFIHNNMPFFVNESCIIYLVILFEKFLKSTMTLLFQREPRGLMNSNKEIPIKDIGSSKTWDDVVGLAISKEIDAVIEGGVDQISEFFKKHNLMLEKKKDWKKFREIFLRRNIIVHNSGYPNARYWEKTNKKPSTKRLTVSHSYVNNSLSLFTDFAHFITDYLEIKYTAKTKFSHSNSEMTISAVGGKIY